MHHRKAAAVENESQGLERRLGMERVDAVWAVEESWEGSTM